VRIIELGYERDTHIRNSRCSGRRDGKKVATPRVAKTRH
jgi:hypothetical protein